MTGETRYFLAFVEVPVEQRLAGIWSGYLHLEGRLVKVEQTEYDEAMKQQPSPVVHATDGDEVILINCKCLKPI